MDLALWTIAGLLAGAVLASGALKLTWPKEKLAASGMGWAEAFSPGAAPALALPLLLGRTRRRSTSPGRSPGSGGTHRHLEPAKEGHRRWNRERRDHRLQLHQLRCDKEETDARPSGYR